LMRESWRPGGHHPITEGSESISEKNRGHGRRASA
jgi:hypothetical protein